jgi:hypothetical protein
MSRQGRLDMLAALKCNPAPIFRLSRGVDDSVPEWKGSVFQVLEGSAPLPSPWGGETAIAEGDVLLVAGAAAVGEMCVLVPWGHGRPMLGRMTSTGFVAEPGAVPCSPRRWRVAGRLLAHLRMRVRGRGKVLGFPGGDPFENRIVQGDVTAHLAWQNPRGCVNIQQAPQGAGDHSVLAEQFLVNQSSKCDQAKGVVSGDPVLAQHCLTMLEPGSMLIVHPGAESTLRGLVREKKVEQLSLFLGA